MVENKTRGFWVRGTFLVFWLSAAQIQQTLNMCGFWFLCPRNSVPLGLWSHALGGAEEVALRPAGQDKGGLSW